MTTIILFPPSYSLQIGFPDVFFVGSLILAVSILSIIALISFLVGNND